MARYKRSLTIYIGIGGLRGACVDLLTKPYKLKFAAPLVISMVCLTVTQVFMGTAVVGEINLAGANLALRKPASQSGIDWGGNPERAVDGNRDAMYSRNSCIHTKPNDTHHWWQVDLRENYVIGSVSIVNRLDGLSWVLKDFVIEISEENPNTLNGFPGRTNASVCVTVKDQVPVPDPVNYKCDQPLLGRYVRMVKTGSLLHFCEFEVYAPEPTTTAPSTTIVPKAFKRHRAFVYLDGKGPRHAENSFSAKRDVLNCCRKFLSGIVDAQETPYIHVDTITGTCHFLRNIAGDQKSLSDNWLIYKASDL